MNPDNTAEDIGHSDEGLFERIASDLYRQGFSIQECALPKDIADILHAQVTQLPPSHFKRAGVGRGQALQLKDSIRTDEISWISPDSIAGHRWLAWTSELQSYLNRRLLLGLYSFESHFAHYDIGDFYRRHLDAFKGEANRILSLVVYLNPEWLRTDRGELVLYPENNLDGIEVRPEMGTIVVFLSEDFPHEVLPAARNRYSIAGWFRVNTSTTRQVDPPR